MLTIFLIKNVASQGRKFQLATYNARSGFSFDTRFLDLLESEEFYMRINLNKKRVKNILTKVGVGALYILGLNILQASNVFAADDPIAVVNNLSNFIFGLIRAVGMIILGFGVVQVGMSLKSHDPTQRANGIMTLAGGIVITFAKEILSIITGG